MIVSDYTRASKDTVYMPIYHLSNFNHHKMYRPTLSESGKNNPEYLAFFFIFNELIYSFGFTFHVRYLENIRN